MHDVFRRVGHGPHTVLVLHGWFGDAGSFEPVESVLDTATFSYLFVNYRGYGARKQVAGRYTIDEIAQDVLALADQQAWPRFSLVGHSMGAMAMERVACLAPHRVMARVGVAPVPACGVRFNAAVRARREQAASDLSVRREIIDQSTGRRLPQRWVQWKADYSWACSTQAAFAAYFKAWADTDFHEESRRLCQPLQLIVGEHDSFHAALMRDTFLAWQPSGQCVSLADCGHYPMNEAPLALVAAMEGFLRQLP